MKNIIYNNNLNIIYSNYKIIIADTELSTFNEIAKIKENFSFINLSSEFAVNFVMEYEKVDYILISNRINNLSDLIEKAKKKKIKIFILGRDIDFPVNFEKVRDLLINDITNNIKVNNKRGGLRKFFKDLLNFKTVNKELNVSAKNSAKNENDENKKFFKEENINENIIKNINVIKKENANKNEDLVKKGKTVKKFIISPESELINTSENNNEKEISINNKNLLQINDSKVINSNDAFYQGIIPENISQDNLGKNTPIEENNHKAANYLFGNSQKFNITSKPEKINYQLKTFKQKIIAVIKAKGGVGSTVISIYLGLLFKNLKSLIVDLNFNEGGSDLGYYLNIPKTPNIMVFTEGFDKNSFNCSVQNVIDSLDVIQSPPTYMQSKEIDLKDIYCLTDIARKKYDLVIFDLPNNINEFYLGVIDLADLLVMVSDCTNGSIGRLLNINSKYIYDELEKILIINKFNKTNPLKFSIDNLKDYFNIKNITTLKEIDILNSKSDFKLFDFNHYEDFKDLSYLATEILTK